MPRTLRRSYRRFVRTCRCRTSSRSQAVRAHLVAGHLAGGVQAGNGGVGVVEDLRVGVDMQTAHGVVHGRLVGHQVVGAVFDGVEVAAEVEVGVVAVFAVLVPLLHGLRQFGGVHAEGLAHGFKRVALYDDLARLKVLVLVLVRDQQTGLVAFAWLNSMYALPSVCSTMALDSTSRRSSSSTKRSPSLFTMMARLSSARLPRTRANRFRGRTRGTSGCTACR